MSQEGDFRPGRHVIHKLRVQLVFMPRFRKPCITALVAKSLRDVFVAVCLDFECELLEFANEREYVRLLVAYPPKVALSKLVNSLKGVSARRLRAQQLPELDRAMHLGAFWSPSYCALSCGESVVDNVRSYVDAQRRASSLD